jgi:hypothetical protein
MTSDLPLINQTLSQLQLEACTLRGQLAHLCEQGVAHAKPFFETDRRPLPPPTNAGSMLVSLPSNKL